MAGLFETIGYFLKLTTESQVLWNITPLAIATIIIILYFELYKEEHPGWNSYLTNSLVLLFVSLALFRYIYELNTPAISNFIDYAGKSIAALLIFLTGTLLLRFNFEHILPERFARYLSSTLTINLIAYAIILYVFSRIKSSWTVFFALLIIIIILFIIFTLIKIPLKKLFKYAEKEKRKERIKNLKEAKFQTDELKRELKIRDKELTLIKNKEIKEKRKEAISARKAVEK